jgi:hypothetical protein
LRRWSDADLITLLRTARTAGLGKSVADLVVETGISIARAAEVYRFWERNDRGSPPGPISEAQPADESAIASASTWAAPAQPERRSAERLAHAALIGQLRDPDPKVRAAAFAELRARKGEQG